MEVISRITLKFLDILATQAGQERRGIRDEGGSPVLPDAGQAQERRVGFDQQPIRRDARGVSCRSWHS
jgi:hypothetical protein